MYSTPGSPNAVLISPSLLTVRIWWVSRRVHTGANTTAALRTEFFSVRINHDYSRLKEQQYCSTSNLSKERHLLIYHTTHYETLIRAPSRYRFYQLPITIVRPRPALPMFQTVSVGPDPARQRKSLMPQTRYHSHQLAPLPYPFRCPCWSLAEKSARSHSDSPSRYKAAFQVQQVRRM